MSQTTIVIPDEIPPVEELDALYPEEYEGHLDRIVIKREEIMKRVRQLAEEIHRDYKGRRPVLVCVLKAANAFFQHLLDALTDLKQGYYVEFLRVSSYDGVSTTGHVQVGGGFRYSAIEGKDVLLVEDIIDTGTTLSHVVPLLKEKAPTMKSVEVVALITKRLDGPPKYEAKYVGFSTPNHFIIGYGIDYNELYRDLKDVWAIAQAGIDFDPKTWDK